VNLDVRTRECLKSQGQNGVRLAALRVWQEQDLPGANAGVAVLSVHSGVVVGRSWCKRRWYHEGERSGRISWVALLNLREFDGRIFWRHANRSWCRRMIDVDELDNLDNTTKLWRHCCPLPPRLATHLPPTAFAGVLNPSHSFPGPPSLATAASRFLDHILKFGFIRKFPEEPSVRMVVRRAEETVDDSVTEMSSCARHHRLPSTLALIQFRVHNLDRVRV
jgi:hypothetical protein